MSTAHSASTSPRRSSSFATRSRLTTCACRSSAGFLPPSKTAQTASPSRCSTVEYRPSAESSRRTRFEEVVDALRFGLRVADQRGRAGSSRSVRGRSAKSTSRARAGGSRSAGTPGQRTDCACVPGEGFEPSRPEGPAGLSRLRLPFRHPGRAGAGYAARGVVCGRATRSASQQRRCARRTGGFARRAGWRRRRRRPCRRRRRRTRGPAACTATTGPPGSRRIVRGAPGRRGGAAERGHHEPGRARGRAEPAGARRRTEQSGHVPPLRFESAG